MTEQGIVIDCEDKFAKVRVERNSACASCGKCGMTEQQRYVDFYADNSIGAQSGDTVTLEIAEGNSAKFALIGYVLPLIPALALLFTALAVQLEEWIAILMFFGGLAVGFAIVAVIDKARKHKWMQTPVIKEIIRKAAVPIKEEKQ